VPDTLMLMGVHTPPTTVTTSPTYESVPEDLNSYTLLFSSVHRPGRLLAAAAALLVAACAGVDDDGPAGACGWPAPQAETRTTLATVMMEATRDPARAARGRETPGGCTTAS